MRGETAPDPGPFVKIYGDRLSRSSILECDVATRWVYMWMLSQADAKGRVRCATVAGLARGAVVTQHQAETAIRELEAPDPDSTTKLRGGRRIFRIPGGWQIVAYSRYREYRSRAQVQAVERQRRKRERDKSRTSRVTSRSSRVEGEGKGKGDVEGERTDGTDVRSAPSDRSRSMGEETARSIEQAAERLAEISRDIDVPTWIQRGSMIEADRSGPSRSFTNPRRRGISEEWGIATLARLREMLQEATRPIPL